LTRTLQTQPRSIIAARRTVAPHRSRGDEPLTALRQRRLIRDLRIEFPDDVEGQTPRIRVSRCRPGFIHPIGRREIGEVLTLFGSVVRYGLRSIELRQSVGEAAGSFILARLLVPGRIVLYEQPQPPWLIQGELSQGSRGRLEGAGATVQSDPFVTRVEWAGDSLAGYMLFDGLMHEIGHHLIQQYTGKRLTRVMRTGDHERRADRFAEACRQVWVERRPPA